MTERPFEDRSEVVKELYSELNTVKPHSGTYAKDLLESKIIYTYMWTFISQIRLLVASLSLILLLNKVLNVITK